MCPWDRLRAFLLVWSILFSLLGQASAQDRGITLSGGSPERRVALVVGNAAYQHAPPLVNPGNDAQDMAAALARLGFETTLALDLTRQGFQDALRGFGDRARDAQAALFFYAGHGLQVDGANYLLPIDARLLRRRDLKYEAISINGVLEEMEGVAHARLVFLDACRDNPLSRELARSLQGTRSTIGVGLAPVEAGAGTLISFAARDGAVASDGEGRNSPYTQALLDHLAQPGVDVGLMLRDVREAVMAATGGQQVPWDYGSLTGRFFMAGPASILTEPEEAEASSELGGVPDQQGLELAFWQAIQYSENPDMFREFLREFPEGRLAGLVRLKLRELTPGSAWPPPPGPPLERSETAASSSASPPTGQLGQIWREPTSGMTLGWVPGGCFRPDQATENPGGAPRREVCLEGFWLGQYEVTQDQWRRVMGNNPAFFQIGGDHPVEQVSWNDLQAFIERLNQSGPAGFRPPTEAEWEYACRGGGETIRYPWGEEAPVCRPGAPNGARFDDNGACDAEGSQPTTDPVGRFGRNRLGLYDMSGNVWEWVASHSDRIESGAGAERLFRGGSWKNHARRAYCGYSLGFGNANARRNDVGARLAWSP